MIKKFLIFVISILVSFSIYARPEYKTPYSVDAPWNRPISGLPISIDSAKYSAALWSGSNSGQSLFGLRLYDYTFPVYYVSDSTTTATIKSSNGNVNGQKIPWNPIWKPAPGSDGQMIILDAATGKEWNFWKVSYSNGVVTATNATLVGANETPDGTIGNYWNKKNGWRPSRGIGIQLYAMLVQPEEIKLGVINHALSMPITNPSKTFYVPPATKLEHSGTDSGSVVPEGARFFLDVTDTEIANWVSTVPSSYRRLAQIVATALKNYGWFITDTSGADGFSFEPAISAGTLWNAIGVPVNTSGPNWTTQGIMRSLAQKYGQTRIKMIVSSDKYPGSITPPPAPTCCCPAIETCPACTKP